MAGILQAFAKPAEPGTAWFRYLMAIGSSALAWYIAAAGHSGYEASYPFLPAFAAVIFSAAWAGPGPAVVSTVLCGLWTGAQVLTEGGSTESAIARSVVFSAGGFLLCVCSAQILRLVGESRESQTRHRQLAETTSEGIWLQDTGGRITWANARMAELLGVPADRLVGRTVDEFYFPPDLTMERIRSGSLTAGTRQQFDRRLRRSDGSELWVLACCNGITGERGDLTGSLAMMTDITERKRAEQALRQSESRYRNLFEGMLEGLYQSTPDGRILAANPMLLKMLDCETEADLHQLNIAHDLYVDPALRTRLLERLEREGGFQNVEYALRTAKGNVIWVLENARAVRDENGEVVHYEGTLTDVTERRRVEDQLRQSQKIEALGRLAAGVALDFSKQLKTITLDVASVIEAVPPNHPARASAERALSAATSAIDLTKQLLDFSRRPVEERIERRMSDAAQDEFPFQDTRKETILLVQDEPLVRELSRDMLERQGYRVLMAGGPREAEEIAAVYDFDLLIAAASMPSITGAGLARNLRAANPGLKVLLISGYDDPAQERERILSANTGYIQKPFSADSLGRRIRDMMTSL